MPVSNNFFEDDLKNLESNLYLFSSDFESLKSYLAGYSDFGIYQECLEGIREPMASFSAIIQSGKISLELIALIFQVYFTMEELARYPNETNNEQAFAKDKNWQAVKALAKDAADGIAKETA